MKSIILLTSLVAAVMTACSTPAPTPDIPATVTAQVDARLTAISTPTPVPENNVRPRDGVEDEQAWENICYRHLGVQRSLMSRFSVNLCSVVNAGELYQVTELSLRRDVLRKNGGHHTLVAEDFAGLVNLESLDIHFPEGQGRSPGVFQRLKGLKKLSVSDMDSLDPGVLDGLGSHQELNNVVGEYDYQAGELPILTGEFLEGLDPLQRLSVNGIYTLEPGALDALPVLRDLSLHANMVPNGMLANLENLRKLSVSRTGPVLELANLEVACAAWLGGDPVFLVAGEVVVVRTRELDGGNFICQVEVGQQQLEIVVDDL